MTYSFQIQNGDYALFNPYHGFNDAVKFVTSENPNWEFPGYSMSYSDIDIFFKEYGKENTMLATRQKDKTGTIQGIYSYTNPDIDGIVSGKLNCVVGENGRLAHSVTEHSNNGLVIKHTICKPDGSLITSSYVNENNIFSKIPTPERLLRDGRAGALQKFAMDLERPGLRRIAGFIFKLAEKIR